MVPKSRKGKSAAAPAPSSRQTRSSARSMENNALDRKRKLASQDDKPLGESPSRKKTRLVLLEQQNRGSTSAVVDEDAMQVDAPTRSQVTAYEVLESPTKLSLLPAPAKLNVAQNLVQVTKDWWVRIPDGVIQGSVSIVLPKGKQPAVRLASSLAFGLLHVHHADYLNPHVMKEPSNNVVSGLAMAVAVRNIRFVHPTGTRLTSYVAFGRLANEARMIQQHECGNAQSLHALWNSADFVCTAEIIVICNVFSCMKPSQRAKVLNMITAEPRKTVLIVDDDAKNLADTTEFASVTQIQLHE
ncbi:hypothetical protein C8F01DRAFT_305932 [Mycena amicta]|nr:hypothetical protein C8F01DRAFT_305932 [Mycena amicta]